MQVGRQIRLPPSVLTAPLGSWLNGGSQSVSAFPIQMIMRTIHARVLLHDDLY